MSTSKKNMMREISIACVEATHSGGVYAFFKSLVAICDEPLKTRLRNEIDDSRGGVSLATTRPAKMHVSNAWWLQRLYAADWETEVRQDTLLKSYMDGVRQFHTGKGRHAYVLKTLLESLCPLFEEFVRAVEVPDEGLVDLRPGADRYVRIQCYRFPELVPARICWENVYGPTEWPDGMDLADAQYDEERATVQAALDTLVEKQDQAAFVEKRKRDEAVPLTSGWDSKDDL